MKLIINVGTPPRKKDLVKDETPTTPTTTTTGTTTRRVAIIGGGVTGLAAAWHLVASNTHPEGQGNDQLSQQQYFVVDLYESSNRFGGHAWTVPVPDDDNDDDDDDDDKKKKEEEEDKKKKEEDEDNKEGKDSDETSKKTTTKKTIDVDIGFMVFNTHNYPNFIRWMEHLSSSKNTTGTETVNIKEEEEATAASSNVTVQSELSDMSLAVSLSLSQQQQQHHHPNNVVEWSSSDYTYSRLFDTLYQFITTLGIVDTYQFVSDIVRFHSTTTTDMLLLHPNDPRKHISIQEYCKQQSYSKVFTTYYLYPMMAALWSSSMQEVYTFPAVQVLSFLLNHQMLQFINRPQWLTIQNRSQSYVNAVVQYIHDRNRQQNNAKEQHQLYRNSKVISIIRDGTTKKYQLMILQPSTTTTIAAGATDAAATARTTSTVWYDDIIFACHPPQIVPMLHTVHLQQEDGADALSSIQTICSDIQYANNVIYVHSDPTYCMPQQRTNWSSWNCIGTTTTTTTTTSVAVAVAVSSNDNKNTNKNMNMNHGTALENETDVIDLANTTTTSPDNDDEERMTHLEGKDGRFKSVYVTYWLNRLQNLQTNKDIFVTLNPHTAPNPSLTYHRVIMGHPQFTIRTLQARTLLLNDYQGKYNLWYCGAWSGYGFHEDGCRSGFDVATQLSGKPVPWCTSNKNDTNPTKSKAMVLPPPDLTTLVKQTKMGWISKMYQTIFVDVPIYVCKRFIYHFLHSSIHHGVLQLKYNDGTVHSFGNSDSSDVIVGCDAEPVTLRIYDEWFFVKTAIEYDLGLARSYMAGYFNVEPLNDPNLYHPTIRPPDSVDETNISIGDPIGLTRLFLLLIGNRDRKLPKHVPVKSGRGDSYSNAFTNASGLFIGKVGAFINYLRYKLTMDNSERGGSLSNIHAHYDLSNDMFRTFLDKETLMYSSAIYDAIPRPLPASSTEVTPTNQQQQSADGLIFRGTLEEAQWRKLDTLLARAQVRPGQTVLDIGFGWGGLSIHAAKKYGCKVTGITLSVEQKALAEERIEKEGLTDLITFEVVDYRTFARRAENLGKFDRVLSCEMIEAVGHRHLGEFFGAVEHLLTKDGILVMEAITTPEQRYETYIRSTDFINTIIFPGSCCPSLHALVDAAYKQSSLTLEHIDNIGLHYAQTLAEWRRRFNARVAEVKNLGFDDVFIRAWNYYLTYCEAGFFSQTENCLILVFARQGCKSLVPLCETRSVTQPEQFSLKQVSSWVTDCAV